MSQASERVGAALADRYRIERELGAGGMATVYLAADLKHDRKVAIKVLKPELAAVLGAERFVQEIKTTAALSHPHILPLFDSGTADGFLFYVMPYIEGETIRDRLNRETQLGVDEAVRITREVADALDYAHRHGVIHRDIKPENLLLHDGRAMVMDFGIALAVSAAAGGRMTETGLSLGTPHYMSPEQATAEKEITPRSDIYSLASVLYEMLAGQPPHLGGPAQQVIMRIITEPARLVSEFRRNVPANVVAAIARALEKLPADRFENAKAFAEALSNPSFATTAPRAGAAGSSGGRGREQSLPLIAVSLLAFAFLAGWIRSAVGARSGEDLVTVRFAFSGAPAMDLATEVGRNLALSPDGNTLVYSSADSAGVNHLFVRTVDDLHQAAMAGTEGAANPFFSHDGREIGFVVGDQLRKIPVGGGPTTVLADIQGFRGASWGSNGIVVSANGNLVVIPSQGGAPHLLAREDSVRGFWPVVLPGGEAVVYTIYGIADGPLNVVSLSGGEITELDAIGSVPLGVAGDDLLFARSDGQLFAAPFDASNLRVTGTARPVESEVARNGGNGETKAAVSQGGTLAYVTGSGLVQVVVTDLRGAQRILPVRPGRLRHLRYSPDGRKFAADLSSAGRTDVYVFDLASGASQRLTADGTVNERPEWSADGQRIVYRTDRTGADATIWSQPADNSGAAELLVASPGKVIWEGQLSPDGKTVVFRTGGGGTGDIWYSRVGGGDATALAATRFNELAPRISPDGRWVAYSSDESGSTQVYVRPFPGPGAPVPVSVTGGQVPVWSRDGGTIFYVSGRALVAATVDTRGAFSVIERAVLFDGTFAVGSVSGGHAGYDVAPDGKGILMPAPASRETERIVVVRNLAPALRAGRAGAPRQ